MKYVLTTLFLAVLLFCGMFLHAANSNKVKLFKADKVKEIGITEAKKDMDFLLNIFLR